MYAMVRIDADVWCSSLSSADPAITSDTEWCQALLREENVFVLPGTAFGLPGTARMVFAAPPSTLMEAASRIVQFCHRHAMDAPLSNPRHRNEKIQTNGVDS
jgi:aspartate/methionine/tyrosine aminotransferase